MSLTNRETEVLHLIAAELTTDQIARRHMLRKAGVKSVTGLVKEAMRQGLIQ